MNRKFLAIIPARGGSKRLANKNILDLCGKPLISWTIEAAKKSKYLDKIIVSSDSEKILTISKNQNIDIIKRPDYLANDISSSIDVLLHTIENEEEMYDYIVLLQPTSPLRNEKHIDEAIELLEKKNAEAIVSVCECEHSPLWTNTIKEDFDISNFLRDEVLNKRSQDLEKYFRLNGAIYICNTKKLIEEKSFFLQENIFAYKMNIEDSVDIDTKLDLILVKSILEERNK